MDSGHLDQALKSSLQNTFKAKKIWVGHYTLTTLSRLSVKELKENVFSTMDHAVQSSVFQGERKIYIPNTTLNGAFRSLYGQKTGNYELFGREDLEGRIRFTHAYAEGRAEEILQSVPTSTHVKLNYLLGTADDAGPRDGEYIRRGVIFHFAIQIITSDDGEIKAIKELASNFNSSLGGGTSAGKVEMRRMGEGEFDPSSPSPLNIGLPGEMADFFPRVYRSFSPPSEQGNLIKIRVKILGATKSSRELITGSALFGVFAKKLLEFNRGEDYRKLFERNFRISPLLFRPGTQKNPAINLDMGAAEFLAAYNRLGLFLYGGPGAMKGVTGSHKPTVRIQRPEDPEEDSHLAIQEKLKEGIEFWGFLYAEEDLVPLFRNLYFSEFGGLNGEKRFSVIQVDYQVDRWEPQNSPRRRFKNITPVVKHYGREQPFAVNGNLQALLRPSDPLRQERSVKRKWMGPFEDGGYVKTEDHYIAFAQYNSQMVTGELPGAEEALVKGFGRPCLLNKFGYGQIIFFEEGR